MSSDVTVGLAGATGALGREILEVLHGAHWRPERIVPMSGLSSSAPFVEYGDASIAVEDASHMDVEALDALMIAVPQSVALDVGAEAVDEGIPVIDCSGAFHAEDDGVPLVVPWVNPGALIEAERGIVSLPGADVILLASVLAPLARAGLAGRVDATVLASASICGRRGVEELSQQVIALFNQGTPPRRVFPSGLAFDILPAYGGQEEDGWSEHETRITSDLAKLVPEVEVIASCALVPVFTGVCAMVHLRTTRQVPIELVRQILTDGGVQLAEGGRTGLRRLQGKPLANVSRLRIDPSGRGLHFFAGMDNVRGAAACAVASAGALLRDVIAERK